MTENEKALARLLFRSKIHEADGDKFEQLFTGIMNYAEIGFQQIKPWGNIGDRKNDGYIKDRGIYHQVYAPEEIKNNYPTVVSKLEEDFNGLAIQWAGIKEFYFVVNDKYHGVNADSEQAIQRIIKRHGLLAGGFLTAKDLEQRLFGLRDDQIISIIGFLPNVQSLAHLDYSVLTEVIGFIMKLPITPKIGKIEFPDWGKKITFNKISELTKRHLEIGVQMVGALDHFLADQPFLSENLQQKLTGLYQAVKGNQLEKLEEQFPGDRLFWELVKQCAPKNEFYVQSAVITIIAKYFESCDVFEKHDESL
jgi:hypothetical protein